MGLQTEDWLKLSSLSPRASQYSNFHENWRTWGNVPIKPAELEDSEFALSSVLNLCLCSASRYPVHRTYSLREMDLSPRTTRPRPNAMHSPRKPRGSHTRT